MRILDITTLFFASKVDVEQRLQNDIFVLLFTSYFNSTAYFQLTSQKMKNDSHL